MWLAIDYFMQFDIDILHPMEPLVTIYNNKCESYDLEKDILITNLQIN